MAHVFTLTNAKGGCGKTTVALNVLAGSGASRLAPTSQTLYPTAVASYHSLVPIIFSRFVLQQFRPPDHPAL